MCRRTSVRFMDSARNRSSSMYSSTARIRSQCPYSSGPSPSCPPSSQRLATQTPVPASILTSVRPGRHSGEAGVAGPVPGVRGDGDFQGGAALVDDFGDGAQFHGVGVGEFERHGGVARQFHGVQRGGEAPVAESGFAVRCLGPAADQPVVVVDRGDEVGRQQPGLPGGAGVEHVAGIIDSGGALQDQPVRGFQPQGSGAAQPRADQVRSRCCFRSPGLGGKGPVQVLKAQRMPLPRRGTAQVPECGRLLRGVPGRARLAPVRVVPCGHIHSLRAGPALAAGISSSIRG